MALRGQPGICSALSRLEKMLFFFFFIPAVTPAWYYCSTEALHTYYESSMPRCRAGFRPGTSYHTLCALSRLQALVVALRGPFSSEQPCVSFKLAAATAQKNLTPRSPSPENNLHMHLLVSILALLGQVTGASTLHQWHMASAEDLAAKVQYATTGVQRVSDLR